MPDGLGDESVTSWRLRAMEAQLKELQQALDKAVGTFGSGITSLQTNLASYQQTISDKYVSRREFDELKARIDQTENRRWQVALALIGSGIALVGVVAAWLKP